MAELEARIVDAPPVRDFISALKTAPDVGLIAEVKKASPSAGIIRADFDPVTIATTYAKAGASCISCLTDEPYFQGKLAYLEAIRQAVEIPIMRKDFILDRYQILEARAAGADCVLLIAECLNDCEMRDLYFFASEHGMECLVELYDPQNLDRVVKLDCPLVGVNNRNLKTFETDLNHTVELAKSISSETTLVAESGIRTRADVQQLMAGGARAILVGETLMKQDNIAAKVHELIGA